MNGDKEIRNEALKQYLRYFRFWMIGAAVILVATVVVTVQRTASNHLTRGNQEAPTERVYDYADVLTDKEEKELAEYIAELEKKAHADLILVTINEPVGEDDYTWENTMMNAADDFYDNGAFGWDRAHGDGALLLDNWYEDASGSQKGSWLSTSGKMERIIGAREEGIVFDKMDPYIDANPCRAYREALKKLAEYGDTSGSGMRWASVFGAMAISAIAAVVYAAIHLFQSKAKNTTTATTYVNNGRPIVNLTADDFLRKSVTSHRISSDSGGSRSHSGGGSYGSHHSSGGFSHGGGGRRR